MSAHSEQRYSGRYSAPRVERSTSAEIEIEIDRRGRGRGRGAFASTLAPEGLTPSPLRGDLRSSADADSVVHETPTATLQAISTDHSPQGDHRPRAHRGGGSVATSERHPVTRTGERVKIPNHVRSAVWRRDNGVCKLCGHVVPKGESWQLDHITPWSAGGSDDSTNLRVLCEWHNQQRSNFIDLTEHPRMAVTWWCTTCFDFDREWQWSDGIPTDCGIHKSYECPVVAGMYRTFDLTGEWPTWFTRDPIEDDAPVVVAYCAHCDAPGLTDRPL